ALERVRDDNAVDLRGTHPGAVAVDDRNDVRTELDRLEVRLRSGELDLAGVVEGVEVGAGVDGQVSREPFGGGDVHAVAARVALKAGRLAIPAARVDDTARARRRVEHPHLTADRTRSH